MDEKWLPIVGYEGLYKVSDFGRIMRTKDMPGTFDGKILKPHLNRGGYQTINIYKNGKRHIFTVHRLVMEAFVGIRPNNMQVNHKDGDKTNNHLDNLEYVTISENHRHAFRTGLKSQRGDSANNRKISESDVPKIRKFLKEETQEAVAARFNVCRATIGNIATGKSWWYVKEEEDGNVEQ